MTTYAEFKDFYTRKMWRMSDAAWDADLPNLIHAAEMKISRDLRHQNLMGQDTLINTGSPIPLPGDFRQAVSVFPANASMPAKALKYDDFKAMAAQNRPIGCYFSIHGGQLHIDGVASPANPVDIDTTYLTGIVPYSTDPAIPFYDMHPDFYMAAVNVQAYDYLKDFELSTEYNAKYEMLLDDMRRESNYILYPSGQMAVPLPGNVR